MLIEPWSGSDVKADPRPIFRRKPEKRHGLAEDIAFAAVYLASDEANWISGQTLILDGGDDILPRRQIPPPR
jgi:NAD(P)-dependent dehydrogenase (short-subunit alcohol dehydrogenase family)